MEKYFIALEPEENLTALVNEQKNLVRELVGEQKYLSEQPHFTLFVLTFKDVKEILPKLGEIANNLTKFPVKICGLHVFYDDIQTNGNTITYSVSRENNNYLKKIQLELINSINDFNTKEFISRNDKIYKKMSDVEKANTDKYGFPFVGENWLPHITIASIEKDKFEKVLKRLIKNEIRGEFLLSYLSLYKISNNSILINKFELK